MNNQSPQQIAEQLARKPAQQFAELPNLLQIEYQRIILQSIPLVELLECIKELKDLAQDLAIDTSAITNLDTKLKQILGEQKE